MIFSSCFLPCQNQSSKWCSVSGKTRISFSLKPSTIAVDPLRLCRTYRPISSVPVVTFLDSSSENETRIKDENSSSGKAERSIGRVGGRKSEIFRRRLFSENNQSREGFNFPAILKQWIPLFAALWILKALLFSGSPSYYYYYESSSVYETTRSNNQNIVRREEKVRTNIPNLSKPKTSITSIPNNGFFILDEADVDL